MSLARNSSRAVQRAILACLLLAAFPGYPSFPVPVAEAAIPPRMVVIRGDAYALRFYPLGRIVRQNARVCLPAGALYLTLQKSDGGTVNYGAPGCNKVISDVEVELRKIGGASGMIQ